MLNIYHANLNIPVEYVFPVISVPNQQRLYHCGLSKQSICDSLVDWLDTQGLIIHHAEFFYTPPNRTLEPHVDGGMNNKVKLNWMVGGYGSYMQWFELKPGKSLQAGSTVINTPYSRASRSDIILKHEAAIGTPSLVNVGQIHAIQNKDQPRYVASYLLSYKNTKQILQWDEAIKIFDKYVV